VLPAFAARAVAQMRGFPNEQMRIWAFQ
jgi:hypothetical protein